MSNKKCLLFDTIPSWYKLFWNSAQHALEIHIAKAYIAALPPIPENSPLKCSVKGKISRDLFSSCSLDLSAEYFGFNECISRRCILPETKCAVFSVTLPRVHVPTGLTCQECDGIGKRDQWECVFCNGSKIEMKFDWDKAYAITESLQMLFWLLDIGVESVIPTEMPQWFTLHICAERDMHGSSMGGHLSKDGLLLFQIMLATRHRCAVDLERSITAALSQSWEYMMGKHSIGYNLRAEVRQDSANLLLTVPGDAAGVYTLNEKIRGDNERGCDISCHNMDNPAQALACLAGLGVFSEALEKAWKAMRVETSE